MIDFGADPKSIEIARKQITNATDFEIFEENWQSVKFFLNLSTQWRVAVGMSGGQYLGLDYQSVEAMMRIQNITKKKSLFADIQIMEREALAVMNKIKG